MSKNREQMWSELNYLFTKKPNLNRDDFRKHVSSRPSTVLPNSSSLSQSLRLPIVLP